MTGTDFNFSIVCSPCSSCAEQDASAPRSSFEPKQELPGVGFDEQAGNLHVLEQRLQVARLSNDSGTSSVTSLPDLLHFSLSSKAAFLVEVCDEKPPSCGSVSENARKGQTQSKPEVEQGETKRIETEDKEQSENENENDAANPEQAQAQSAEIENKKQSESEEKLEKFLSDRFRGRYVSSLSALQRLQHSSEGSSFTSVLQSSLQAQLEQSENKGPTEIDSKGQSQSEEKPPGQDTKMAADDRKSIFSDAATMVGYRTWGSEPLPLCDELPYMPLPSHQELPYMHPCPSGRTQMLCVTRKQTVLNPGFAITSLGGRATTSADAGYIRRYAEDLVKQRQLLREMWLQDADPNRPCSGKSA